MSQSSTAVREPLLRIAKREGTTCLLYTSDAADDCEPV